MFNWNLSLTVVLFWIYSWKWVCCWELWFCAWSVCHCWEIWSMYLSTRIYPQQYRWHNLFGFVWVVPSIQRGNIQCNILRNIIRNEQARAPFVISDINECLLGLALCDENSECENTEGDYICRCLPGFNYKQYTTRQCESKFLIPWKWIVKLKKTIGCIEYYQKKIIGQCLPSAS